jgi:hypothetical protein
MLVEMVPQTEKRSEEEITYVIDRGLVRYVKYASGITAIMISVVAFAMGLDLRGMRNQMDGYVNKMKDMTEKYGKEVEERQNKLEKQMETARGYAESLSKQVEQIEGLRTKAEASSKKVEDYERDFNIRIKAVLEGGPAGVTEKRVLQILQGVLKGALPKLKSTSERSEVEQVVDAAVKGFSVTADGGEALAKIEMDMSYAVTFLNRRFGVKRDSIPIVLLDRSFRNAYWDGEKYHCPPQVADLPDVTYHEAALAYISGKVTLEYSGQSGALLMSFADIFTALIKQEKKGISEDDFWLIAPGAGAWLAGKDIMKTEPRVPLRSMSNPGHAYRNDPLLGTDPQPDHFSHLYTGSQDNGGVHINSGIPNKAFYSTARVIGTDKASEIWYSTMIDLRPDTNFYQAAMAGVKASGKLFGPESKEQTAVKKAWEIVGVLK